MKQTRSNRKPSPCTSLWQGIIHAWLLYMVHALIHSRDITPPSNALAPDADQ